MLFAFVMGMPGPVELAIIAVIVVLIFGPKQLPKMARSIGSALPSFQKGMAETKAEIAAFDKARVDVEAQAKQAMGDVVDAAKGKVPEPVA